MKKVANRFVQIICALFFTLGVQAQNTGIFQTYVILDINGTGDNFFAGGINSEGGTSYGGQNFGLVSSFTLNGGQLKSFQNSGGAADSAAVFYNIHPSGNTTGEFSEIRITSSQALTNPGDLEWQESGAMINVLDGLVAGTYDLEVFWRTYTTNTNDDFDSNFGNNYTATFTVETPGFYDDDGTLTICPAGSFCPGDGNSYPCSAGFYASSPGSSECIACTTVCPAGQIISTPCTATSNTVCFACDDNSQLSSLTASGLVLSPAFDPSILSYSASTECLSSVDVTATAVSASSTLSGSTGTVALTSGVNILTVTVTSECLIFTTDYTITIDNSTSPGFYNDNGVCTECPAGSFCPGDGTVSLCPVGSFSASPGAAECELCLAGTAQNQIGSTSCVACPAGTFSNIIGAENCTACASGEYQDQPGSVDCIACDAGSTSPPGSIACTPCAAGEYIDNGICTECPPGSFCPGDGTKTLCPAGRYSDVSGASECLQCLEGTFSGNEGATFCTQCPAGTFSNVTGASACADCPAGTFQANTGATTCDACDPGFCQEETGQTACTACSSADLVLTPSSSSVSECDTITVMVSIVSEDSYNTVEARLNFDPAELKVLAVTAPDGSDVITNNPPFITPAAPVLLDNTNGEVAYAASTSSAGTSGDQDFMRITFEVLGNSGLASLTPIISGFPRSRVATTEFIDGVATPVDILDEFLPTDLTLNPDTEAPVFTCPSNATVDVDANCAITIPDLITGLMGTDNCGSVSFSQSPTVGTIVPASHNQVIDVTITADDGNTNQTTCTVSLTAQDVTAPSITCTSDFTLYLDDAGQASIGSNGSIELANSVNDFSSVQGEKNWEYGTYAGGFNSTFFTQLPYDASQLRYEGGSAGDTPFITNIGGHPNIGNGEWAVRRWTSSYTGAVTISGTLADLNPNTAPGATSAHVRIFQNGAEVYNYFNVPVSQVPYTTSLNISSGDQIDFVVDANFDTQQDFTEFTAVITAQGASATDNCGIPTITATNINFDCSNVGANTVTFTATDLAGNSSPCNATVAIVDDTAPTITCNADISLVNDAGICGAIVTYSNSSSDNCSGETISQTAGLASGAIFPVGTTTNTFVVTDASGNTATCSFDVTVTDNEAPEVTGNITASDIEGCSAADAPAAETTVAGLEGLAGDLDISENCSANGDLTVASSDAVAGTCPTVITRTYTVTDEAGNTSASFTHVINVDDTTLPTASAPTAVDVQCSGDVPAVDITVVTDEADNCGTTVVAHVGDANNGGAGSTASPLVITRTYSVTDACGNSIDLDQIITVIDDTAPVVTGSITASTIEGCVAGDAPAAETTAAGLEGLVGDLEVSDNCSADGALTVASSDVVVGTCPTVITRTYTVTDVVGNTSASFTHIINVDDTTNPTASAPAAVSVQCLGDVPAVDVNVVTDEADNCGTTTVAHVGDSYNSGEGTTASPLIITRTYSVTDGCFNSINLLQFIAVVDDIAPVVAGSITASNIEGCSAADAPAAETTVAGLEALAGDLDISDNCSADGDLTVASSDVVTGTCPTVITRTYTVTDEAGNVSASFDHVINVDDTTNPTASAPNAVDVQCSGDVPAVDITVVADEADNCGTTVVAHVGDTNNGGAGTTASPLVITRTYSVTDACGNSIDVDQIITVIDDTAPVLAGVPADETAQCDAIPAAASPTATDNCDASPLVTLDEVSTQGVDPTLASFYNYTITRTWTATDASGNSSSDDQVITVEDDTAPVLAGVPADETVQCDAIPTAASPTATDNCDASPLVTLDEVSTQGVDPTMSDFYNYTITRTWTASDASGNSVDGVQVITVEDDTAPVLAGVPADETVQCDAIPTAASPTATDNCDASPSVTLDEVSTQGVDPALADFYNYTITRTWTATDASGNSSSDDQVITVEDDTAPVLAGVPADETVQCDAIPTAASPTATDNCDANPSVSLNEVSTQGADPALADFYNYTITRTWTATDASGNSSSDDQVITVEDNTAPVLAGVPADETVQCDAIPTAASPTATDNCDANPSVSLNEVSTQGADPTMSDFYNYTITRTWTASDASGNSVNGEQVITVEDNTAPVLAGVPANETVQCDAIPTAASPTATDNCDASPSVTLNEASTQGADPALADFYNYTITRTWTAEDASGNSSSDDQVITVEDDTAPVLAGMPVDETVQCDAIPTAASPTATDNCDANPSVTLNEVSTQGVDPALADFYNYTITRTWTASDASGNSSSDDQVITVEDDTAPVLAGVPADETVQCDAIPTAASPTATDNCDASPSVTLNEASTQGADPTLADFYNYTITRTWTATDASGNSVDGVQVITVEDDTAPVLAGVPADETVQCDAVPTAASPTATDNCDASPSVTLDEVSTQGVDPALADFYNYTITRTWTASDASGNSVDGVQVITVEDDTAPTIACVADPTVTINQTNNTYLASGGEFDPTFSDNCSGVTISHDAAAVLSPQVGPNNESLDGWEFPIGTTTIRFTAADASGNSDFCDVTITVEPTQVSGNVVLNGACYPIGMTLTVYPAGSETTVQTLVATLNAQIDVNGDFSVDATGVVPGNYDVYLKPDNYLARLVENVNIGATATNIAIANMIPGDIDATEDNLINGSDVSLILGAYNTTTGDPLFDPIADINCDGFVDALDLSLIIFFFPSSGDSPLE